MTISDLLDASPQAKSRLDAELLGILAEMKKSLAELIGGEFQLVLYGSYARGEQGEWSDVDLMLILPDSAMAFETKEEVHNIMSDFSLRTSYLFSVLIVSESQFRENSGFMVFGSVEREGIPV